MNVTEVYDLYAATVYKFFYIKCLNRDIAEDLTSQTFMVCLEKSQDLTYVIGEPKKFLYGVMRNVWLMYLRQRYTQNEHSLESLDDFEPYVLHQIDEYESQTVKQRAEQFINQLPEKQRWIVSMRLLEEVSIKDIATRIGKDSNYVKTTYKRGLKNLKAHIEQSQPKAMVGSEEL